MSLNCKKATLAAGRDFVVLRTWGRAMGRYVPQTVGYACPQNIYNAILAKHQFTLEKRQHATEKKEDKIMADAEAAMDRVFPSIPAEDRAMILDRAFEKGSHRIGRKAGFSLDQKIMLAAKAHIRYNHTDFENVLEGIRDEIKSYGERYDRNETYDQAVAEVDDEVEEIVDRWRTPRAGAAGQAAAAAAEDEDEDEEGSEDGDAALDVPAAPGPAGVKLDPEAKDEKKEDLKNEAVKLEAPDAEPAADVKIKIKEEPMAVEEPEPKAEESKVKLEGSEAVEGV